MRPPEKFRTATRFCAADQRYKGRKLEPRAYLKGLDVRTMSGRGRNIFLDILFIECNQALAQACAVRSPGLRCRFDCFYRVERTSSRPGVTPAEVQRLSTAHVIANYPGEPKCSGQSTSNFSCHPPQTSV